MAAITIRNNSSASCWRLIIFASGDNLRFDKKLEPKQRFIQFLLDDSKLRDEFGIRSCSRCFSVVSRNAGPRSQHLLTQDLRFGGFRQNAVHLDYSQRKTFCSVTQLLILHGTLAPQRLRLVYPPSAFPLLSHAAIFPLSASGSRTMNVAPWPWPSLWPSIVPPWSEMMR
jgi:hypothetical protein